MCGLVGMAGNVVAQDHKMLRNLLMLDVVRGIDSTGLAVVHEKDNKIGVVKRTGMPGELFMEPEFDEKGIYCGPRGKVFIGHNRAATKGSVNDKNAHPFHHGDVVGAHNGTLTSSWQLEDDDKFEVDSEAIFYNLSKYQIRDTISNVNGAYALTWYDKMDDKLYIIRNNQRPLYWTRRKDRDVFYWASESWMLSIAAAKAGVTIGEIESFDINKLYELNVANVTAARFRNVNWGVSKDTVEGYKYVAPKRTHTTVHHVGSGGKPNNVVPFVAGNSSSAISSRIRSEAEIGAMKALEDKVVPFRFGEVKVGISSSRYLKAIPSDTNCDFDIRIYGDRNHNWDNWVKDIHKQSYQGKVKRVVHNKHGQKGPETYLLIDLRTIEKIEDKEDDLPASNTTSDNGVTPWVPPAGELGDTEYHEGFQGRWLSPEEWKLATCKGCSNCSGDADDADEGLTFFAHDEFLCGTCIESFPEYKTVN